MKNDADLSMEIDLRTQLLLAELQDDGALGVVVLVAFPHHVAVGCASDVRLADVWPDILRQIATTIGARARRAAQLPPARADGASNDDRG